ncbi:MAG TPA: hypothetical protein VGR55_00380 [Candidatus Acidoferrum sp.]|nr:hypothetical protein [Candidatus Acidoferrum sp.]
MHWLLENYKWLFDGVGGAAALAIIGYLIHRFRSSQDQESAASTGVTQVTNSPVASGSGITQTVNSPTINLSMPVSVPEPPCDFWLEFHPTGSRPLRIKNSGAEPAFDVVIRIPADGSGFKSGAINRLDNDGGWVFCGLKGNFVYLEAIRKVLAQTPLGSAEEVRQIPVLITYRTRKQQDCEAHLEIRLPLKNGIQFALPQIQPERSKRALEELESAEARPEQALDDRILEFLENGVVPGNRPFTGAGNRLFRANEIADALSVPKSATANRLVHLETQGRVRRHDGTLDNPAPYWSIVRI